MTSDISSDSGVVLGGIASWDEQGQPAHLPTAIKGLGPIERAQWFAAQRQKEKNKLAEEREERRESLRASGERLKRGVDDHFSGGKVEHLEVSGSASAGLHSSKEFSGEAARVGSRPFFLLKPDPL